MGVIDPEPAAIDQYLWVIAQGGIKISLEAVSAAQTLINPLYEFEVEEDLYRPTIEQIENKALVNILIGSVISNENETNFNKTHVVTYNIDCYVRGKNEDDPGAPGSLVPADEVAVQRLKYLCAMVEFGLTNLANFYEGLESGEIMPDKIDLTFNPVDDAAESATPYAPARFTFVCKFPYDAQDLENLPLIDRTKIDLTNWASEFIY